MSQEAIMTKIRMRRSRKGFALVTVVIVGAILVACSLMFTVQLQTERTVAGTDAVFKQALDVAEQGFDTVVSMISGNVVPSTGYWAQYFATGAQPPKYGPYLSRNVPHAVYSVVVSAPLPASTRVLSDQTTSGMRKVISTGTVTVVSTGLLFAPSTTGDLTMLTSGWTARRAVSSDVQVTWEVDTVLSTTTSKVEPETMPVRYGVYTGANLSISGSSKEIHGDVFANGNIDVQKSSGIQGGVAYAAGTLSGAYPLGSKSGVTPIEFPTLEMSFFQQMFTAYTNGTYPYDGTNIAYTNMKAGTTDGDANRAKYNVSALIANPANYSLYKDPTAVYYVNGPLTITSNVELHGTIAVNGDFTIHGNTDITHGTGALPAIVVNGNIIKENGNSSIYGVMMCSGTFTGNGSATITGSLMCAGTVTMNGHLSIAYDGSQGNIDTGGTITYTTTPGATTYAVVDLSQPSDQSRAWKEVLPQ
jgi:hypothetical protein